MNYCRRCGAYIPDGLSACVACGYDEARETGKQTGKAERVQRETSVRDQAERRLAQKREEAKAWAENERRRRQETEERRAERFASARQSESEGSGAEEGARLLSILGYIGPLFFLPLAFGKSAFAKFHGKQALKLFLASAIGHAICALFGFGFIVTILRVVLSVVGIKNAMDGKEKKLPYIGDAF